MEKRKDLVERKRRKKSARKESVRECACQTGERSRSVLAGLFEKQGRQLTSASLQQ